MYCQKNFGCMVIFIYSKEYISKILCYHRLQRHLATKNIMRRFLKRGIFHFHIIFLRHLDQICMSIFFRTDSKSPALGAAAPKLQSSENETALCCTKQGGVYLNKFWGFIDIFGTTYMICKQGQKNPFRNKFLS